MPEQLPGQGRVSLDDPGDIVQRGVIALAEMNDLKRHPGRGGKTFRFSELADDISIAHILARR
jgi:hypothetical protein